ncbi:MAG: flagellin [Lentisphaerae bacterium]|nr:MAG: flagellin [Lentisphaerota bacterium]
MRSQIRNSAMARQNVDNGISLIQTADAWLQKINDMLSRMSELAVNANDGTKTPKDIENIQSEFSALQDEIVRITSHSSAAAKFNGLFLLRGGSGQPDPVNDTVKSGSITVQIGADGDQKIKLDLANLEVTDTTVIGTVHTYTYSTNNNVTSSTHTQVTWASVIDKNSMSVTSSNAISKITAAINYISNNRAKLGAQQARLEQTRSGLLAYEDNLRTAESKIRDIDIALESTEFTRGQILTQLGNAMLTQANQLPQAALQLIR